MNNEKVRMVALRTMFYDVDRVKGEEFDVQKEHVNALLMTEAAALVDKKKAKHYFRRDMRAEA
jgi:hypothetical protein